MAQRTLRIVVSLVLMAVFLAIFLWKMDPPKVWAAVEQTDLVMVTIAIVIALVSYWFRAVRWHLILRPVATFRHSSALLATAVGYAAMALLPARMGDLVRPIVLARRERLPVSAALASILTERIFDLWTVVLYFLVFLVWPPPMPELGEQAARNLEILQVSGYAFGAALVLGTLVLLAMFRYQDRFVGVVTRPVGRIRKSWQQPVANFLNHFLNGLRVLQRPRDLMITMAASLLLWYLIYWQVRFTLLAFDLDFPLRVAYLLTAMAVIGLAIPSPGGIGGFHFAIRVTLTAFFAVEMNRAIAVAIVYHAICFVPITVIGLLCLPLVDLRLREMDSLETEASES
jgi:uncharacterized protein (TIRG00374 family)